MPGFDLTLWTLPDVGQRCSTLALTEVRNLKGRSAKTGSENNFLMGSDGPAIPKAIPTLSTMPDLTVSPRTYPDVSTTKIQDGGY